MDDVSRSRIEAGEKVDDVLGRPSVVVGVEADVGDREDWYDWWPRPVSAGRLRIRRYGQGHVVE